MRFRSVTRDPVLAGERAPEAARNRSALDRRWADRVVGALLTLVACGLLLAYELAHLTGYAFGQTLYSVDAYDEGVYMATGSLMAHGFRLYSQIYSAQPPLLPAALSLPDRLFGSGVAQARATILLFGLLAVVATVLISGQTRGWIAGGLSGLLLALSPEFMVYSHAVEEEIPVMALGALALALALKWRENQRLLWSVLAGLSFGLAVLTKFFAFALLVPLVVTLGLAIWDEWRVGGTGWRTTPRRLARDVAGFVVGGVIPIAASFAIFGASEWKQMVADRISATSAQAALQSVSNVHQVLDFAGTDPGLAILAVAGGVLLLVADWRLALIFDSWGLATLAVLLRYHPLMGHHPVILLSPAAALGGIGLSFLIPPSSSLTWVGHAVNGGDRRSLVPLTSRIPALIVLLAAAGLVLYLALLPRLAGSYQGLLVKPTGYDTAKAEAAAWVRSRVPKGQFVAAGDAWICVLANRLCVPDLVDTSDVRIQTGKLSASQAIADMRGYHVRVVALGRRLCDLGGFAGWVKDHFRLMRPLPLQGTGCTPGMYARQGRAGRVVH